MYRNQQVLVTAIHIHLSLLFPGRAKSLTLELSQEARISTLVGSSLNSKIGTAKHCSIDYLISIQQH
jgi:hypothetical protein